MSKSTLSITVNPGSPNFTQRVVEVPYRLPDAFTFWFHLPGYGKAKATALLCDYDEPKATMVDEVEIEVGTDRDSPGPVDTAHRAAEAILEDVKRRLGLLPMEGRGDVLTSIALAYEAEVAAYDAAVKAHAAMPRFLHSPALIPAHPSGMDRHESPSIAMLAKYVEHVVEQACKAQTERAEAQAKVFPSPSQVTP